MSDEIAQSVEGATVIKHDPPPEPDVVDDDADPQETS